MMILSILLLIVLALQKGAAWSVASPSSLSGSRSKLAMQADSQTESTTSRHDYVYLDPTTSWAADLYELEQLEAKLEMDEKSAAEERLRDLRRHLHQNYNHMHENHDTSTKEETLEELRRRLHLARQEMQKTQSKHPTNHIYVDPKAIWGSDVAQLEQLEAQEADQLKELQLMRRRHHEAYRNNMHGSWSTDDV